MMESEQEGDFLFVNAGDGAAVSTEEVSLDTSVISAMPAIRVDGVPPSMPMKYILLHFESKKESGGGNIVKSHDFRSKGFMIFVYETSEVVEEVLKRPQEIDGHRLKVSRYEEHIPAQETDIVQEKLEKSRTVSVRGLPRTSSTETLTYYFENKRRSKGGPVEGVTKSLEEDVFFVKFDDPEDAASVASHEHILEGRKLQVCIYTPPQMMPDRVLVRGLPDVNVGDELKLYMEARSDADVDCILYGDGGVAVVIFTGNIDIHKLQEGFKKRPLKNATLEVEPIPCTCTIQVHNLPESSPTSEDMLRNYFENKRRSGGGEVTRVRIEEKGNYALITFEDATVASEVLSRSHTLQGKNVELSPFYNCLGPSGGRTSPPVKIPERQSLSESAKRKIHQIKEISHLWQELESFLKTHYACLNDARSSESLYIECTLTQETEGVRELAPAWPEDVISAVEDYLSKITVEEVEVTSQLFSQSDVIVRDIADRAGAFIKYDSSHSLLVVVTKDASASLAAEMKRTFGEAEEKMKRKSIERCEDIELDRNTYLFFVKKHRAMKEIQETYPQLKVNYDHEREVLRLTGTEREIDDMKKFCTKISIYHHMWDMDAIRSLFLQGEAQRFLKTICRETDPEGDIEFTEGGIKIYSLGKNQTTVTKETCLKHVRREKIPLSEEFSEVCRSGKWRDFEKTFKDLGGGTVLMKEESTQLIIVGIGQNFDACCEEMKRFFKDNAIILRNLSVEEEKLTSFYGHHLENYLAFHNQQSSKSIKFERGCISVTGTAQVVSEVRSALENLKMNRISNEKTLDLPSLSRFLASDEGKREVADIEKRLKCKILDPTHQSFALFTSDRGGDGAPSSLQLSDQGSMSLTGATGGSPPDNGQQTRNFADPTTHTKAAKKSKVLPVRPRIFLNPMSDITKEEHDVLVNSSNTSLNLSMGQVSMDLLRVGGSELQTECKKKYPKGIQFGDIAVTGKGRPKGLFCKNVFHCCLKEEKDVKQIKKIIKKTISKCLQKANEMGRSSIGFPAIGTGTLQFPPKIVAEAMFKAIAKFGHQHPDCSVSDVVIILHKKDLEVTKAFKEVRDEFTEKTEDPASDLEVNPNSKGVKEYKFFQETSVPLTVIFVGLEPNVPEQAEEALVKAYKDMVIEETVAAHDLQYWDDFRVKNLEHACRPVYVDLTFMFELDKIRLRGFRDDVSRVPYSEIMKEAERHVNARRHADLMSKQVRWSWVEVGMTGEKLRPYDEKNNYIIEMGYREGKPMVFIYDTNNKGFIIRFHTMDEIVENPLKTQKKDVPIRVIRQDLVHEVPDAPLPPHWSAMSPNDLFDEISLRKDSDEYKRTEQLFRTQYRQPGCTIEKISRIQNPTLYRQYMAKMMELKNDLPQDTVVEREPLWHGTKGDRVQNIISLGFNRSYCRQDDTRNAYGDGVYFATSAEYAARQVYAEANTLGRRHVFLCRVLVGQFVLGQKGMRVLPKIPTSRRRFYNSAVDDQADPTMFVIFNDTQAYPKYLIVFK